MRSCFLYPSRERKKEADNFTSPKSFGRRRNSSSFNSSTYEKFNLATKEDNKNFMNPSSKTKPPPRAGTHEHRQFHVHESSIKTEQDETVFKPTKAEEWTLQIQEKHRNSVCQIVTESLTENPFGLSPYTSPFILPTGEESKGTVTIITETGWAITNFHVVKDSINKIFLRMESEGRRQIPVDVYSFVQDEDLALIKIPDYAVEQFNSPLVPVLFGNDNLVPRSTQTAAWGYPLGAEGGAKITVGVLSGSDPNGESGGSQDVNKLQTSTLVHPGSSGSPLFLPNVRVIGIISSGISEYTGTNFVIPSSVVMKYLPSMFSQVTFFTMIPTPHLGALLQTVTQEQVLTKNLDFSMFPGGMYVTQRIQNDRFYSNHDLQTGDVLVGLEFPDPFTSGVGYGLKGKNVGGVDIYDVKNSFQLAKSFFENKAKTKQQKKENTKTKQEKESASDVSDCSSSNFVTREGKTEVNSQFVKTYFLPNVFTRCLGWKEEEETKKETPTKETIQTQTSLSTKTPTFDAESKRKEIKQKEGSPKSKFLENTTYPFQLNYVRWEFPNPYPRLRVTFERPNDDSVFVEGKDTASDVWKESVINTTRKLFFSDITSRLPLGIDLDLFVYREGKLIVLKKKYDPLPGLLEGVRPVFYKMDNLKKHYVIFGGVCYMDLNQNLIADCAPFCLKNLGDFLNHKKKRNKQAVIATGVFNESSTVRINRIRSSELLCRLSLFLPFFVPSSSLSTVLLDKEKSDWSTISQIQYVQIKEASEDVFTVLQVKDFLQKIASRVVQHYKKHIIPNASIFLNYLKKIDTETNKKKEKAQERDKKREKEEEEQEEDFDASKKIKVKNRKNSLEAKMHPSFAQNVIDERVLNEEKQQQEQKQKKQERQVPESKAKPKEPKRTDAAEADQIYFEKLAVFENWNGLCIVELLLQEGHNVSVKFPKVLDEDEKIQKRLGIYTNEWGKAYKSMMDRELAAAKSQLGVQDPRLDDSETFEKERKTYPESKNRSDVEFTYPGGTKQEQLRKKNSGDEEEPVVLSLTLDSNSNSLPFPNSSSPVSPTPLLSVSGQFEPETKNPKNTKKPKTKNILPHLQNQKEKNSVMEISKEEKPIIRSSLSASQQQEKKKEETTKKKQPPGENGKNGKNSQQTKQLEEDDEEDEYQDIKINSTCSQCSLPKSAISTSSTLSPETAMAPTIVRPNSLQTPGVKSTARVLKTQGAQLSSLFVLNSKVSASAAPTIRAPPLRVWNIKDFV